MDVTQHIRGSNREEVASKDSKLSKINISELMDNYKQPYGKVATHETIDTKLNSQLVYEVKSVNKIVRADVVNITEDTIVVDRGGDTKTYSYEDFDKVRYIHASGDDNLLERNSQYFDNSKEDLLNTVPSTQVTTGGVVSRITSKVKLIIAFAYLMVSLVVGSFIMRTLFEMDPNRMTAIVFALIGCLWFLQYRNKVVYSESNLLSNYR